MTEILRKPSCEALIEAIQENEIAFWLSRARLAGWDVHEEPGLTWWRAHLSPPRLPAVLPAPDI